MPIPSILMVGKFVIVIEKSITSSFVDFYVVLDCPQVRCSDCFLEIWGLWVLSIVNDARVVCRSRTLFVDHLS